MTFGIDFDETFSRHPKFFHELLDLIEKYNHKAVIVTARFKGMNNQDVHETTRDRLPIVFTGMNSKREYCEANNIYIDVWVDDSPERI